MFSMGAKWEREGGITYKFFGRAPKGEGAFT